MFFSEITNKQLLDRADPNTKTQVIPTKYRGATSVRHIRETLQYSMNAVARYYAPAASPPRYMRAGDSDYGIRFRVPNDSSTWGPTPLTASSQSAWRFDRSSGKPVFSILDVDEVQTFLADARARVLSQIFRRGEQIPDCTT